MCGDGSQHAHGELVAVMERKKINICLFDNAFGCINNLQGHGNATLARSCGTAARTVCSVTS